MQVLRGRLAAKGRVGSVRKTGLKCIERQVNCNGHIHLFRIVPFSLTLGIRRRLLRDLLEADSEKELCNYITVQAGPLTFTCQNAPP